MRCTHVVVLCVLMLTACGTAGRFILENRQNLGNLSFGMSKSEVHAVMGQKTVRSLNNPYRSAMYIGRDGNPVEVFYYFTDGSVTNGITDDELTPVVFIDGKVAGWGREFWSDFVTKYELRIRSQ